MKTSGLMGASLNWAVAKALGSVPKDWKATYSNWEARNYSKDWAQGGPIIEREGISVEWSGWGGNEQWDACIIHDDNFPGPTPLIAAMRCFVASKLGNDVEVPKELEIV